METTRRGLPRAMVDDVFLAPVHINAGGTTYTTTLTTLTRYPGSKLAQLFDGTLPISIDPINRQYFIDINGSVFVHILDFLRYGELLLPDDFTQLPLLVKMAGALGLDDAEMLDHTEKSTNNFKPKKFDEDNTSEHYKRRQGIGKAENNCLDKDFKEMNIDKYTVDKEIEVNMAEADNMSTTSLETQNIRSGTIALGAMQAETLDLKKMEVKMAEADNMITKSLDTQNIRSGTVALGAMQAGTLDLKKMEVNMAEADKMRTKSLETQNIRSGTIALGAMQAGTLDLKKMQVKMAEADNMRTDKLETGSIQSNVTHMASVEAVNVEMKSIEAGAVKTSRLEVGTLMAQTLEVGTLNAGALEAGSSSGNAKVVLVRCNQSRIIDVFSPDEITLVKSKCPAYKVMSKCVANGNRLHYQFSRQNDYFPAEQFAVPLLLHLFEQLLSKGYRFSSVVGVGDSNYLIWDYMLIQFPSAPSRP